MLDILPTIVGWRSKRLRVALALLTHVEGSAPRAVGSAIAVNERGDVAGSISGGCVETDVYEALRDCLADAQSRSLSYGIDDEEALEHGLTCGGTLSVFCRALNPADDDLLARVSSAVGDDRAVILATRMDAGFAGSSLVVADGVASGTLGSRRLDSAVLVEATASTETPYAIVRSFGSDGQPLRRDANIFVQSFAPKADLFIFGAVDFSRAMASVGRLMGYRVTVIDARPVFATAARIPDADRIVVQWPDEFLAAATIRRSTALVVLTHDLKFDVPLLRIAVESEAGYIGVMGSRQTNATRMTALREAGVSEAHLRLLHAPIGLDIGARSPEETAISIAAEMIAARNGRRGGSLREGSAALHGPLLPLSNESLASA